MLKQVFLVVAAILLFVQQHETSHLSHPAQNLENPVQTLRVDADVIFNRADAKLTDIEQALQTHFINFDNKIAKQRAQIQHNIDAMLQQHGNDPEIVKCIHEKHEEIAEFFREAHEDLLEYSEASFDQLKFLASHQEAMRQDVYAHVDKVFGIWIVVSGIDKNHYVLNTARYNLAKIGDNVEQIICACQEMANKVQWELNEMAECYTEQAEEFLEELHGCVAPRSEDNSLEDMDTTPSYNDYEQYEKRGYPEDFEDFPVNPTKRDRYLDEILAKLSASLHRIAEKPWDLQQQKHNVVPQPILDPSQFNNKKKPIGKK